MEGSYWFRRLVKEAKKISPHIRFKRIKYGFYRIYLRAAYIGECHKDMPLEGHDVLEKNYHLEDQRYQQEYESTIDSTARLKNFKEGYHQTLDRLRTRVYMFKHNREFYKNALRGYSQMRVK